MSLQELQAKSFSEQDTKNLIKFLNLVHTKIDGLNAEQAIDYVQLMGWAKNVVLPKMQAHLMGEPKIVESTDVPTS